MQNSGQQPQDPNAPDNPARYGKSTDPQKSEIEGNIIGNLIGDGFEPSAEEQAELPRPEQTDQPNEPRH